MYACVIVLRNVFPQLSRAGNGSAFLLGGADMNVSGYRLGRTLKSSQVDRRDYVTYLQSGKRPPADEAPSGDIVTFTLTAGQLSVLTGYNPAFAIGGISAEPLPDNTLSLFYSRSDDHTTTIQFDGDVTAYFADKVIKIDGVPMPVDVAWVYDPTPGAEASAAQWASELFTSATDYVISW